MTGNIRGGDVELFKVLGFDYVLRVVVMSVAVTIQPLGRVGVK
jgi:hypothetical protein